MFHHVFLVWNFDLPTFLKIPKLTWEQPLLHLFLCRPIGGVFFVFAFPHGKTWVFCTPENSRVPKSPFRCFFIRVHFSHPSTNWSDFFFWVGGLIWDDALDWMFFLVLFWESWEILSFFMFFCAYAAVSMAYSFDFGVVDPLFFVPGWSRYLPTQVHLVSYRWTWCSSTLLSTCHGHHTTQLHSAFLPNVTWMAQKFRWRKGHPWWPLHYGIQLK